MPFHLISDRKFFLPDKSIIYELAILLEETMADTVSFLQDNFTQDKSILLLNWLRLGLWLMFITNKTGQRRHIISEDRNAAIREVPIILE